MTLTRPLVIGLIVSATLNVFLVGGVVGALWVRQAPPALVEGPPTPPPARPGSPPDRPSGGRGVIAGAASPGEAPGRQPLWTAGRGLSAENRQALRRTLREANQRNQTIMGQARVQRRAALQAFEAEPYDPAVVSQHLTAARTLDAQARTNVEASLAAFAARLSAEERKALAQGLERVYAPRARPGGASAD